jgi:CheY-like chemotaxis protein
VASRAILLVDDDTSVREAMRDLLELEGYSVVDVGTALDALRYLRNNPRPLIVIVDWNMAPMDAPAFMKVVNEDPDLNGVPVVLVTADPQVRHKAEVADFAGCLVKPIHLEALFAIIDRYSGAS